MERDVHVIEYGDRIVSLYGKSFSTEVDMDELTTIHYDNLIGEILTISTLMNRVGILKANAENALNETKLGHKILEAKKSEELRRKLTKAGDGKSPTVSQLENAVTLDEVVQESKMNYYTVVKQAAVVDSLYWAVKSKEMKLNHITQGITPEDFEKEILEGEINSVMIKISQKKF